jgi:hypothetical protein
MNRAAHLLVKKHVLGEAAYALVRPYRCFAEPSGPGNLEDFVEQAINVPVLDGTYG